MANETQKAVLDLLEHVTEPLDSRPDFQNPFPTGPVTDPKQAAEIGERLKPRLGGIGVLPRGRIFSAFKKSHMIEAMRVVSLLLSLDDRDRQLAMTYLRDNINEELFVYAISVLVTHQPQMRNIQLPPIEEILPTKFIPAPIISQAVSTQRRTPPENTEPIVISSDFTGNDLDIEHRLAYWREDIALNAHHWHWHIVYPFTWTPELGGSKDRKGELFYYMHQQIVARYDSERMSHNLPRVSAYNNWDDPVPEGYAPHLNVDISGTEYAPRPVNLVLQDIPDVTVNRLLLWYNRIINSIHEGSYLQADGTRVPFDEFTGIDKLGDIIEATAITPNENFYGDFHNSGHDLISRIHDPDERFRTEIGVMGDPASAMRDPIFYRWHKFIDLMFQELKNTLNPYTRAQLTWNDVTIESALIRGQVSERPNNLQTYWQDRQINLERGINFNRSTPVSVVTRHLQHETFAYNLTIRNSSNSNRQGTVRIFLAPSRNEVRQILSPNDQRHLFIELDKFEVALRSGSNTITRQSIDSNVTVPTLKSFTQLVEEAESESSEERQSSCSCGLPDHLLIPRGKPEGMEFQLCVMVTNAEEDRVPNASNQQCQDATSYCGILNALYPDRKPMGFPFDRRITEPDLATFRTQSMIFTPVTIRFRNEVVDTTGTTVLFPIP